MQSLILLLAIKLELALPFAQFMNHNFAQIMIQSTLKSPRKVFGLLP
jgi:hypothetical protein